LYLSADDLQSARTHYRHGRLDDALADCQDILATTPDDIEALQLLGQIQARKGNLLAAAEALERASSLAPGRADLHKQAGEMHGVAGSVAKAETLFRKALAVKPEMYAVRYNLALVVLSGGRLDEACELLASVVAGRENLSPAWLQYGGVLNALGRYAEAEKALRRHLELTAESVPGWTWLGACFQFQGHFENAEACYRKAIEHDPQSPDPRANLGKLLQAQGKPLEAGECFRAALEIQASHPQALSGMATWLDNLGRYDEALDLLNDREGAKASVETAAIRARLLGKLDRYDEARSVLEQALADHAVSSESRVQLRFSLARILDRTGDYDRAMHFADEANSLRKEAFDRETPGSDLTALEKAVTDLERYFSKTAMADLPRSDCGSESPVFILGMPRSGKSLTEQILCSHPAVQGAGELTDIPDISSRLAEGRGGWPACVSRLSQDDLEKAATAYLATLERAAGDRRRVTDTMPFNYLHLGLIELLFPRARVIHCVRHPLDLALRCYFKNFAGRSLAFSFDLESIVRYIHQYQRMMTHWQSVSSLAIYESRYEQLVGDPETGTRSLVAFLGLQWSDDCLRFYEEGVATSESDTPLRRPLDSNEVGGWCHYRDRLAPYGGALDTAGYDHVR
jgi:tetratricopeptide (TPR) repeat protein